ncbi:hypothetical protein BH10ACI1_BH10ACI1_17950 [soil metagenome]
MLSSAIFVSACYKSETSDTKTTRTVENSSPSPNALTTPSVVESKGNYTQAKKDYDEKNYEKAIESFQQVIQSEPTNFQAQYYLGNSRPALKKDEEAILAFKEAIKIKPEHAESNFELGNIYYGRKNYDTALPFYQQAVKTNFKDPVMLMALGDNYSAMKKNDFAIVQYLKVVEFDKTNSDAMYKTGLAYISMNNKIAARQQAQRLEPVDAARAKKLLDMIEKM